MSWDFNLNKNHVSLCQQVEQISQLTMPKEKSCDLCPSTFVRRQSLYKHKQTHAGKRFKCSHCKKSFSQKATLTQHSTIHSGGKSYTCSQCDKSFTQKGNLTKHSLTHVSVSVITLEKSLLRATNALIQPIRLVNWRHTSWDMLERNLINAINVNTPQQTLNHWRRTS